MKRLFILLILSSFLDINFCQSLEDLRKQHYKENSDKPHVLYGSINDPIIRSDELRPIYGDKNPCVEDVLNLTSEELKELSDRDFEYYKLASEKCENYKKALIEIEKIKVENMKRQDQALIATMPPPQAPQSTSDRIWETIGCIILLNLMFYN